MLENSFWREGIIFCFRMSQYMLESMFPSMNRSTHAAPDNDATTTMLDYRQGTIFLVPSNSATSKAMLAALMHLFFEASFCTWRTAQGLLWSIPCEACSEWNSSWKTSVWPWPLYCNLVSGCYRTSYSLGHLCGESNNFNSQILRKLFAMRYHVEHAVVSLRELYSKNQILTALKQDTQICMVLSSRQKHEHDE